MKQIIQTNSMFQEPWWLDAVAKGKWQEIKIERDGYTVARLPYVLTKGPLGLSFNNMPPLTQVLGPWVEETNAKYPKQLATQKKLISGLISQLPDVDYFSQCFHYSIINWLPFYWHGYKQTTRYTYVLENIKDYEKIYSGFMSNIKTDIKKAENKLEVTYEDDINSFINIHKKTFTRQGMTLPYSEEYVRRLDKVCQERSQRKIIFAKDAKNQVHAAVYVVWDDRSAYYLMSGGDPALRSSGATSLLIWEAIKWASHVTERFDFEGSMIEPVERFFRAFGAIQKPYYQITKMSRRMRVLMGARDIARAILGKD